MPPDDTDSEPETAFCINCGEEISADAELCPECGSGQVPENLGTTETSDNIKQSGFTSWAIGFKPGQTGRNILVGIVYLLFLSFGIPLLIYGYVCENPEKSKYVAWITGALFILVALGAFVAGSTRGIIAGGLSLVIGLLFLPVVREKLSIESPPGITEGNTSRRNLLTGVAYGLGSMVVVGAALPATETDTTDADGATSSGDGGSGSTDGTEEVNSSPEFSVRIVYSDSWQGAISVTGGGSSQSESISGRGTERIEITGDVDILSANAQKQDDSSSELTVEILHNGDIASEASTASAYGVAQTSKSF